jgi:integrase
MASTWIRWRETKDGARLASLQWRDPDGRVCSEALHTSDERVAKVFLQAKRRDLGIPGRRIRSRHASVRDAVEGFLTEKSMTVRPATVSQYRKRLEWLVKAWQDVPVGRWDRALYVQFLEGRGWSPRSIELQTAICKQFIAWAHDSGHAVPDFVSGYKPPRVYRKNPTTLSEMELDKLLLVARGHGLEPAIALGALAGLRLGEIEAARWDDVDWAEGVLTIHGTKTHRDRAVPLTPRLREVLERHKGPRQLIVRAACSISSLKTLCRKAEVPEISWHPLRHTCATLLFRKGVPSPTIRDWLGHVSIATTNIYGHSSREDMRRAAEALG